MKQAGHVFLAFLADVPSEGDVTVGRDKSNRVGQAVADHGSGACTDPTTGSTRLR